MANLMSVFSPRQGLEATSPAIILPTSSPNPFTFSYSQLHSLVLDLQSQLASFNLVPGTSVSSSLGNGIEFTLAFLATGAQRLIAAPLNPNYSQGEVEFYLQDTKSQLLLLPKGAIAAGHVAVAAANKVVGVEVVEIVFDPSSNGSVSLVRADGSKVAKNNEILKPEDEDVALILHTSGTTGRPKGVPLTHKNLYTTMSNIIGTYNLIPSDRTYLVMPLFHVHGLLCGLLATLLSGGSAVIPPKFSATVFWNELSSNGCNWYTAVPTIHQMLLNSPIPNPVPKLRFIRSCSSALSPSTFHQIEKTFNAPVLEAYAMTEAAHQMTSNPLPPAKRKPGTVGIGHGVEIKILDDAGNEVAQGTIGEVCVRGANVTKGYLNNPKANEESFVKTQGNQGFFRTGDQGRKDADGYVELVGRIKELINRSGEKISPLEVDAALLAVEGVKEAVSFAMPDKLYGEKVGAVVILHKEKQSLSEKQIQSAMQGKLTKFKIPERIWITDVIPKTATGKIQRKNVAATFLRKDGAKL
ncbi:probable PCS60 - AMP-binding protein, peroxisomal [Melanopsichium pennsylvanicum]|uniref:Probable PCS60 - AMP-binding protein, peroxisomal n=2 Tax=Melanopsichium pennsylvanicum TaxID=63383 RepID=A0AAJ5C4A8_9BASI|nr:probable PCS60-AMP-binding protein, peroxisomal [Melanopsichium pennsylvanicum 4]SNX83447.1 probable PCS60 - AMP-binding protein, peroxisomal [Melanopsichium pennsylvanicum]